MGKRGQGAFEYILLLAGVLLIVVLAIIILRGTLTSAPKQQISQAQCLAAIAKVSACYTPTGGWDTDAGLIATDYGVPLSCFAPGGGLVGTGWFASYVAGPPEVATFNCGMQPA
ncbi:MAG: class III signal peptide-containing protein [Candidatus Micrarchaeota archaeon]